MVLEKTLESPLDSTEIKPVNLEENQPWIFIRRTDAEGEAPILWPPDVKSQLTGKDFDAGRNWRQEEKGTRENETVGWRRWLNGHEFEQTPGDDEGQWSLECCSPWGHNESDMTEWLDNNNKTWILPCTAFWFSPLHSTPFKKEKFSRIENAYSFLMPKEQGTYTVQKWCQWTTNKNLNKMLLYKIFLYGPFFKVFIVLLLYCFCFMFLFYWPQGMWDLNFLTRDWTYTSCIGRQSLNQWTAMEVPKKVFYF